MLEIDATQRPYHAIVRWALDHLSSEGQRDSTLHTSGVHCAVCAAAHGLARMGRVVQATSADYGAEWTKEPLKAALPVVSIPITSIIKGGEVEVLFEQFAEEVGDPNARALPGD